LRHLFVKFFFDFGKSFGGYRFGIPFCQCLVSAGADHSKFLNGHCVSLLVLIAKNIRRFVSAIRLPHSTPTLQHIDRQLLCFTSVRTAPEPRCRYGGRGNHGQRPSARS
jgi:hypothetical protein